ncbi:MAG: dienelactone hydrolase family protein [Hyphomicrobiales bacterium]|nr:dienelactone hydrolase family protein [Hyphomicrobiales bacterium]
MGETVTLTARDGHELNAYRSEPKGTPRGGLVIIQEIFGVNTHIRAVADSYAGEGFIVLAPALFDRFEPGIELGYAAEDIEKGREIRGKIAHDDAVLDMGAAVDALREQQLAAAVVGYCWGGSLAWNAATRLDGVACAVGYYGGMIPDMADEDPRSPVMLHFGETDGSIPLEGVERVKKKHPDIPVHLYPAGHGFNCDMRDSYDAESAAQARKRTLAFLAEHLSS